MVKQGFLVYPIPDGLALVGAVDPHPGSQSIIRAGPVWEIYF